jgi:type 2 lantibiotic biosynthesis protein LanM
LYVLAHLSALWGEPELLAQAQELAEELPERIAKDQDLDIISGAAGCIAGLLCVHSRRPSARVLEVARQCGEHLLAHARQMPQGLGWQPSFATHAPLTGFSHGTAGISWALLELSALTGEERFRTAALHGIAYERSLFSAEAGNWPDLRVPDGEPNEAAKPPEFPVAWCHGAPGIGLARLLCRRLLNDPMLDEEIETALCTTLVSGFGHNHCLCHGDLGNLELLLMAAQVWPEASWGKEAERQVAGILSSINRDGWCCGNPLAAESPGLMTGLAGIGYGLLRCADPKSVPSVLCLAPPMNALARPTTLA